MNDHQRYTTVTGSRHALGVVDPALVDFLGILPDVGDCLVVIETVDPVHILFHVIRPVTLGWIISGIWVRRVDHTAPDQVGNLVNEFERLTLLFGIAG